MFRRQFMTQTALAGAVALPTLPSIAQANLAASAHRWSLLSETNDGGCEASAPCHTGTVHIRVRPDQAVAGVQATARLWFLGDAGPVAYELASFATNGTSQSHRLVADSERLLSLECQSQSLDTTSSQQLVVSQTGMGHLGHGRHWLVLHDNAVQPSSPDQTGVLARIELTVSAV